MIWVPEECIGIKPRADSPKFRRYWGCPGMCSDPWTWWKCNKIACFDVFWLRNLMEMQRDCMLWCGLVYPWKFWFWLVVLRLGRHQCEVKRTTYMILSKFKPFAVFMFWLTVSLRLDRRIRGRNLLKSLQLFFFMNFRNKILYHISHLSLLSLAQHVTNTIRFTAKNMII